jgi:hypothetical protein
MSDKNLKTTKQAALEEDASGFLLCDLKNDEKVTLFLRGQLNTVMAKHHCAPLIIHHTPKINFVKLEEVQWYQWMYGMAGCGALTNWARAILVMAPSRLPGTYRFIAAKRFDEIQWTERESWFSHSKKPFNDDGKEFEIIEWVPSSDEQILQARPVPKGRREVAQLEQVFNKMSPVEWYTTDSFLEWTSSEFHLGENKARRILGVLQERELVKIDSQKRRGTNPLKRYRKSVKSLVTDE